MLRLRITMIMSIVKLGYSHILQNFEPSKVGKPMGCSDSGRPQNLDRIDTQSQEHVAFQNMFLQHFEPRKGPLRFMGLLPVSAWMPISMSVHIYKVNRCLARYSPRATTNNRPTTGHWNSLHGLAQIDQICQFWAKFGRFWAINPFFYWRNQKFCYPHNEKST